MPLRDALATALSDLPVDAAWLFGSYATHAAGPLSDVDVAVLPTEGLDADERTRLQYGIADVAMRLTGRDRSDVVMVDDAPPGIAFSAICGVLVLDRQPERRVDVEVAIMRRFHDRRHYEDRWERATRARYREGGFA